MFQPAIALNILNNWMHKPSRAANAARRKPASGLLAGIDKQLAGTVQRSATAVAAMACCLNMAGGCRPQAAPKTISVLLHLDPL